MRKRTYLLWKKLLTRLFIFGVIVGSLYVYFHTGFFTLQTYVIEGAPEIYQDRLQSGLRELAGQKLFKLLPGNRSISYHTRGIRTLIKDTLPNTESISIRPTSLHTLTITLTSYKPIFSIDDTHAIARDGTIYREIIPLVEYPKLAVATGTVIAPETLMSLSALIENLSAVLFKVTFINIDEYGDVRVYDETRSKNIIIASKSDMVKVWSNILSAIDTDPLKSKLASQSNQLEYIDARFGNKVFYKFTNRTETAIIPSDATNTPPTISH